MKPQAQRMEESRRLGGARSRVLLLCVTLFFTVVWADSDVTPGTVTKTTHKSPVAHKSHHVDGGNRWKGKTDWHWYNDSCYRYMTKRKAWGDAEGVCQRLARGSHLVSIHSKEDIEYLKNFIYLHKHFHRAFWLGTSNLYMNKHFKWTDGSPMDFKNWHPDEPNSSGGKEHCVCSNYGGPGLWGEVKCDTTLTFICKAPNSSKDKPLCSKGE
ncbi:lectin-like [Lissotriton helveticus]